MGLSSLKCTNNNPAATSLPDPEAEFTLGYENITIFSLLLMCHLQLIKLSINCQTNYLYIFAAVISIRNSLMD